MRKMRYILWNSDTLQKCEIFFEIQILCEYVNYSTKMQILRKNTNILRNAGTMQILRENTTQKYYTEIRVANIRALYEKCEYNANTTQMLCEYYIFTSRCNDAKIQANRLLRVYRAELLVRLDQFSYTHS